MRYFLIIFSLILVFILFENIYVYRYFEFEIFNFSIARMMRNGVFNKITNIKYIGSKDFIETVKKDISSSYFKDILHKIHMQGCSKIYIVQHDAIETRIVTKEVLSELSVLVSMGELYMPDIPSVGDGIILLSHQFNEYGGEINGIPKKHIILYHEFSHMLNELVYPEIGTVFSEGINQIRRVELNDQLKAEELKQIFIALAHLNLAQFQMSSNVNGKEQAVLYARLKLSKFANDPVPDEDVSAEIYFIKLYLETVMPFEIESSNVESELKPELQNICESNLLRLKEIYRDYLNPDELIEGIIKDLKEKIISEGIYIMPQDLEVMFESNNMS